MVSKKNKYGNRKPTIDGIKYDSVMEAQRHQELKILEKAGAIQNLRRQVEYELLPNQYENYERYGKRGQRLKDGRRVIERKCVYVADFVYQENGETVVEDAKGFRTADYLIKRKLMLYIHGIHIRETGKKR